MSRLTAKQRAQLPARAFGFPEKSGLRTGEEGVRQLPDARLRARDQRQATLAKQREDGNLTKDESERINRKVTDPEPAEAWEVATSADNVPKVQMKMPLQRPAKASPDRLCRLTDYALLIRPVLFAYNPYFHNPGRIEPDS